VLGATWQRCRAHGTRNALAHVPKGQHTIRPGGGPPGLPAGGRPAPATLAEARRPPGRERGRRPGLHGLPGPAPRQAALHEPAGAAEQGGQAAGRRGRHLPRRALDGGSHNVAASVFEWAASIARGRLKPRYGQGCGKLPLNLRWQPDLRGVASGGADAPAQEDLSSADRVRVVRDHAVQHPIPDRGLRVPGAQQAPAAAARPEHDGPCRRGRRRVGPGR
jgi:hypothetical protein